MSRPFEHKSVLPSPVAHRFPSHAPSPIPQGTIHPGVKTNNTPIHFNFRTLHQQPLWAFIFVPFHGQQCDTKRTKGYLFVGIRICFRTLKPPKAAETAQLVRLLQSQDSVQTAEDQSGLPVVCLPSVLAKNTIWLK
jgi:hypothetical protein